MTISDPAETVEPATIEQLAASPDLSHNMTYLGASFAALTSGETYMATPDGGVVRAPDDLPQRATRYQNAIDLGRQVAQLVAGVYLPELRAFQQFIAPAFAEDPYAVGGDLHTHAVILSALEAFHEQVVIGEQAAAEHRRTLAAQAGAGTEQPVPAAP